MTPPLQLKNHNHACVSVVIHTSSFASNWQQTGEKTCILIVLSYKLNSKEQIEFEISITVYFHTQVSLFKANIFKQIPGHVSDS